MRDKPLDGLKPDQCSTLVVACLERNKEQTTELEGILKSIDKNAFPELRTLDSWIPQLGCIIVRASNAREFYWAQFWELGAVKEKFCGLAGETRDAINRLEEHTARVKGHEKRDQAVRCMRDLVRALK